MAKSRNIRAIGQKVKMVVRGQKEKTNREILDAHVLRWKEVQRGLKALGTADRSVPGWDFTAMFEGVLLNEVGAAQRAQGRMAVGKNQKYIQIAKAIENGSVPIGTKLSDLKLARAYTAEHKAAWEAKLYKIDMIISVAEKWQVNVITEKVIQEAERIIAAERARSRV